MVKVLAFDVFGTVVDWRGSIIEEGKRRWASIGIDWEEFTDTWRGGYQPAMERVRRAERGWVNIDTLHREILDELLAKRGISNLSEAELNDMNHMWHRLDPWPEPYRGDTLQWQCFVRCQRGAKTPPPEPYRGDTLQRQCFAAD